MLSTVLNCLVNAKILLLEVSMVSGYRKYTEGVGVAKATLPALYSDNCSSSFDDVELESVTKTESDTIVNLLACQSGFSNTMTCLRTSVCHWWLSIPLGSGYQNG